VKKRKTGGVGNESEEASVVNIINSSSFKLKEGNLGVQSNFDPQEAANLQIESLVDLRQDEIRVEKKHLE